MKLPKITLGIEEEYQIIDPETRELKSFVQEFLDRGRVILKDQIKPEFLPESGRSRLQDLSRRWRGARRGDAPATIDLRTGGGERCAGRCCQYPSFLSLVDAGGERR